MIVIGIKEINRRYERRSYAPFVECKRGPLKLERD